MFFLSKVNNSEQQHAQNAQRVPWVPCAFRHTFETNVEAIGEQCTEAKPIRAVEPVPNRLLFASHGTVGHGAGAKGGANGHGAKRNWFFCLYYNYTSVQVQMKCFFVD